MDKTPPYTTVQHHTFPIYDWRPGVLRRVPWMAVGSIILAIFSATASAAVIVISNGRPATWKVQPSVLLSLLASIATSLLVVALSTGVTITWWRTALTPHGTTLSNLHDISSHGQGMGILASLLMKRNINKIAIAWVVVAIAGIAYSPLLQRASHTKSLPTDTNITMYLDIYTKLPDGYGGTVSSPPDSIVVVNPGFLSAIQDWYNGGQMWSYEDPGYYCNGTCKGYVPSPGIDGKDCQVTHQSIDMLSAARNGTFVFAVNFTRFDDVDGIPTLQMTNTYVEKVNEACIGTLTITTCNMHAATVSHPIIIEGINVSLDTNRTVQSLNETYSSPGDLSSAAFDSPAGPLGALQWFGESYFTSNATLSYNSSSGTYLATTNGVSAHQYYDTNGDDYIANLQCGFLWKDPSQDILRAFGQVLFRASLYAADAANNPDTQTFTAVQTAPTLTYESEHVYLIIASLVLLFGIIAALYPLSCCTHTLCARTTPTKF